MRDTLLICDGRFVRHRFEGGTACKRCRAPLPAKYTAEKHGPQDVVCQGKYRSHRFTGQPTCYRCGISQAEVRRRRMQKWCEIYKHHRGEKSLLAKGERDPYAAGYEAFSKELKNPFKSGTNLYAQWFEGWHIAAAEADRKARGAA